MNGTRGLAIAIVASLVVGISAGLIAGVVIMRFAGPLPPAPPRMLMRGPLMGPGRPGDPMARAGGMMLLGRLERELDLSASQRAQVLAVLERARAEREAARESVRVRIERVLTPAQQARWREMESRYPRMMRGRAGLPGPWEDRRPRDIPQ